MRSHRVNHADCFMLESNLSRTEFNLFFDNVDETLDESCDPSPIEEEGKLSHLAFADYLATY